MTHQVPSQQDPCSEPEQAKAPEAISDSRRKLLIAGGSIAPVVLTLASRPVLGADCVSPSATLSSALSHKEGSVGECSGYSASYWKTNKNSWPSSVLPSTLFSEVFSSNRYSTSFFFNEKKGSNTLLDVLNQERASHDNELGALFVTAYLNIRAGLVSPTAITEQKLKQIWQEWANNRNYTPFAGASPWDGPQIKRYLTENQIAKNF